MKKIKIDGTDMYTLVDDDDFEELSKYNWKLHTHGYAYKGYREYMHRIVNRTPKGMQTDHINGNKLDNRKDNLRTCTRSQNQININRTTGSKVSYRGVTHDNRKISKPFQARIRINGVLTHLGYFRTPKEAAAAYNAAATEHHGEFAVLNEIK